jgi:hypothetical protein
MKFRVLETLVLERDIPERGLHKGDLGADEDLVSVRSATHGAA